ncbi:MAG: hypothetical protein K9K67_06730 [Bacteriovoracaceae bacterium]|nr:hypothetical protein [Bacteriovoracaceae bacterium]
MKLLLLISLIFSSELIATEGIGGSEGGPGSKYWNVDIPRNRTVDWPMIRIREGRSLPINQLCILDRDTLRTIKKYGVYGVRFDRETFLRFGIFNKKYQFAERYFDDSSCHGAWDPKCDIVNSYVEDQIEIPIYGGAPQWGRDGLQSIREFTLDARLLDKVKVKVPKCRD